VGSNYLGACAAMTGPDEVRVQQFHAALADVCAAAWPAQYPCYAPTAQRWYRHRPSVRAGAGAGAGHPSTSPRGGVEDRRPRPARPTSSASSRPASGRRVPVPVVAGRGGGFDLSGAVEDLFALRPTRRG
jgi:hypothetical protein